MPPPPGSGAAGGQGAQDVLAGHAPTPRLAYRVKIVPRTSSASTEAKNARIRPIP